MLKYRMITLLAALAFAAPAVAQTITVNCTAGKTIGAVLAKKEQKDKLLVLRVQGTCMEDVTIDRDDVTLDGDVGATILGSITIDGARRVTLKGLGVTSASGSGVLVTNGGSATIRDCQFVNNGVYGVVVLNTSFARLVGNQFIGNGSFDSTAGGVLVNRNSGAFGEGNTYSNNAGVGVELFANGIYRGHLETVTQGSGQFALTANGLGHLDLRGSTVTGNADVSNQSRLRVQALLVSAPGVLPIVTTPSTMVGTVSGFGLSSARVPPGVACNLVFPSFCQFGQ